MKILQFKEIDPERNQIAETFTSQIADPELRNAFLFGFEQGWAYGQQEERVRILLKARPVRNVYQRITS